MIRHEELISNAYDDIRFQHVLVEEMGELLPAKLLGQCDLSRARSVLEIGCGTGEWLRAVAQQYEGLQCLGIDEDELQVKTANAMAWRRSPFSRRRSTLFPPRSFPGEASTSSISASSVGTS